VLSRLPLNPLVEGGDSPTLLLQSLDIFLEKNLSNVICLCLLFKILRKCCITFPPNWLKHLFTTATLEWHFSTRFCDLDQYPNSSLMSVAVILPSLFFSSFENNSSATSAVVLYEDPAAPLWSAQYCVLSPNPQHTLRPPPDLWTDLGTKCLPPLLHFVQNLLLAHRPLRLAKVFPNRSY